MYFYAQQCDLNCKAICKSLAPEFAAAASQLASLGSKAVMAKVDADSTTLAARFNVTGFPTLIWFENGQPQVFTGLQKDRSDLVFWVVTKTDVITRTLTDQVCV